MNLFLHFLALWYQVTVRLLEKDRDNTILAERSHEVHVRVDESRQEAKMAKTEIHRSVIASVPARHERERRRTEFVEPSSEVRWRELRKADS